MPKNLTPIETFLAPLAKIAAQNPGIEAEVLWANGMTWDAQDDASEMLDGEEIGFYAEGLLIEGFHLHWQVLAQTAAPTEPVHARLFFWQGDGPTAPLPEDSLAVFAAATWGG